MLTMAPLPTHELPAAAWRRLVREVRIRTAPQKPRAIKVGATIQEIAAQIRMRQQPRFFGLLPEQAALAAQFFPDAYTLTLLEAERICAHQFDLLGSGPVDLGPEINWHRDFKSGHVWPQAHHTRLKLTDPQGGFDVKVPWELSRFHHALRLGQAYLYTREERYAAEITGQISHWIKHNPQGFGVNWAGPMDVAIRAVNWIWAYYMILESEALTPEFLALWLVSLRQHGEYLMRNLEDHWPRTNHFIANLTGLAYLGLVFPEFPESARWRATGIKRLWEEIETQVNPDGFSYEASTSYHRLVTEMALSVAALCVLNSIDVPQTTLAHLYAMLDAIMAYTPPDGHTPAIGDADDGRLLPLSVHVDPARSVNDHRHLLALGSIILERESIEWAGYINFNERGWALAAGQEWQDAFWYFASDAAARYTDVLTRIFTRPERLGDDEWVSVIPGLRVRARALSPRPIRAERADQSRGLEASGLYIMRSGALHMAIDAGDVGQLGMGGHAHNDVFSITLNAYGQPLLIDPGSYLYTSHPAERNAFRSTAYHNTLQVNGEEINPLPEAEMFRLSDAAAVRVAGWVSNKDYDLFDGTHDGYVRLKPGLLHRRLIWFGRDEGLWLLHDEIKPVPGAPANGSAGARHKVEARFHFPALQARIDAEFKAVEARTQAGPGLVIMLLDDSPFMPALERGWYAPRFGVKREGPVANFSAEVAAPAGFTLILYPFKDDYELKTIRSIGRTALAQLKRVLTAGAKTSALNTL